MKKLPVVIDIQGCKHNVLKPHPCPYRADVFNDSVTKCTCCRACQAKCARGI